MWDLVKLVMQQAREGERAGGRAGDGGRQHVGVGGGAVEKLPQKNKINEVPGLNADSLRVIKNSLS